MMLIWLAKHTVLIVGGNDVQRSTLSEELVGNIASIVPVLHRRSTVKKIIWL